MQMEASDAFDISREPAHVRERYGKTTQARQILIARRLVERGVRYVQDVARGFLSPGITTTIWRFATANWLRNAIRR